MRKIILLGLAIILWSSINLHAQMEKGKFVIGGSSTFGLLGTGNDIMSFGVSTIKYKSDADGYNEPDADKLTSINLIPKIGYMVSDNFLIGVDLSLAYAKNTDGRDDDVYSQNIFAAGAFLRYYLPTNSIKPFVEVSSSFGTQTSKYESGTTSFNDESKESLFAWGGGFGISVPIGNIASFDALAGYTSFTMKDKEDNPDNERMVVGTIGLKLGFLIFLGN